MYIYTIGMISSYLKIWIMTFNIWINLKICSLPGLCNENNKEPLVTTVNLLTHSCSSSSVGSAKIYFSLKTPKVDDTGKLLIFNGM